MERSITLLQQQIERLSNKANLVNELRKLNSDIKISWLAAHPASKLIEEAGEYLLPEAVQYSNDNILAEKAAKGPQLNLLKYLTKASKEWKNNMALFNRITNEENYDITIGDETCEIIVGFQKNPSQKKPLS